MRAALALALVIALGLTGCGRLRDDPTPQSTPSPTASQVSTDDVSELLDQATDTLDQVERDLQTGDDSVEKE